MLLWWILTSSPILNWLVYLLLMINFKKLNILQKVFLLFLFIFYLLFLFNITKIGKIDGPESITFDEVGNIYVSKLIYH